MREEASIFDFGSLFAKALRSYQTGGITYSDFLGHVNRYLEAGQSPVELLEVLRRRQLIEPLPDFAYDAVARLLTDPAPSGSLPILTDAVANEPLEVSTEVAPEQRIESVDERSPTVTAESADAMVSSDAIRTTAAVGSDEGVAPVGAIDTAESRAPQFAERSQTADTNAQVATPAAGDHQESGNIPSTAAVADDVHDPTPVFRVEPHHEFVMAYPEKTVALTPAQSDLRDHRPAFLLEPAAAVSASPTSPASESAERVEIVPLERSSSRGSDMRTASVSPRVGNRFGDQALRPRATPSLTPILPKPSPVAAPPIAVPPAVAEKTVAISRSGALREPGGPLIDSAAAASIAAARESFKPPATPERRSLSARRTVWLGAIVLVILVGLFFGRRMTTPRTPPASGDSSRMVSVAPVPAPVVVPTPALAVAPGSVIQDCPGCPQMTVLPAGRFKQGSAYDDPDALPAERPQHIVLIRHSLAMATTELTVGNFREYVAAVNPELQGCEVYDGEWRHRVDAGWQTPGFAQGDNNPVTCLSWKDAVEYAAWLSIKTGHHYRLPSASEWEYGARGGTDASVPWSAGLRAACATANVADQSAARRYPTWGVFACKDGYVNTAPVGSFSANAFGLKDVLGNVFEWTADCWHDDYVKAPIDGSARMDGECSEHELRGGSWFSSPPFVRFAYRNHFPTGYRSASIGVRLVREMTP